MTQNNKIKMGSNKSFGLVFFIVFLIIAFWSFRGEFSQIKIFPLFFSVIFLVLGVINSKILTPLNKLSFKFGILLGAIIAPIVMGIVFFTVVTPTGVLMKFFRKDLLKNKFNKNQSSYWIKRNKPLGTMKKQF